MPPNEEEIKKAKLELDELKKKADHGEIVLLFEDETVLWRFPLPRAGWWVKETRARIPQPEKGMIKREEKQKRAQWEEQQSWSAITTGVLMYLVGAVLYGSHEVIFKMVPHFNGKEYLAYLYQMLAQLGKKGKEIVLVQDNSKIHKSKRVNRFLEKNKGKLRIYYLPERAGHRLNPIEGFWKVLKGKVNVGTSYESLHLLHRQAYNVLTQHRISPIFNFSWLNISA